MLRLDGIAVARRADTAMRLIYRRVSPGRPPGAITCRGFAAYGPGRYRSRY
jgi:hypothetical protein